MVSFWDFQEPSGPFMSKIGTGRYALEESSINKGTWTSNGTVERVQDSPPSKPFGPLSASIKPNQIIEVRNTFDAAPLLNIHGDNATLSMLAWMKPIGDPDQPPSHFDFGHLAGIWAEPIFVRTYVMFCPSASRGRMSAQEPRHSYLDTEISRTGETMQPACRWSTSYALGSSDITATSWHLLAMTFDSVAIRAYVNGSLDYRPPHRLSSNMSDPCNETWQNPAPIQTWTNQTKGHWGPGGLPSGNKTNFIVGGQTASRDPDGLPLGGLGHPWTGLLAGLAVYDRALTDVELAAIAKNTGF